MQDTPYRVCSIDGCEREAGLKGSARGWCRFHYSRWYRSGDPLMTLRSMKPVRLCSAEGCKAKHRCRGYCQKHYKLALARGEFPDRPPCAVEGCDVRMFSRGYCRMHYWRVRKNGEPGPAERIYDGSGFTNRDGYRVIVRHGHPNARQPNGNLLEHTFVMSEHLGRPLRKGETVHHRNGIKDDNRLENLELWASVHAKGQRPADLVAFARQVLADYGDEVDRGLV